MVFTGVWVTASLFKSPGLFLVFWLISTMLSFGYSPLVLLFPYPPVPVPILWWVYLAYQLQLVSPSSWCSIFFFQFISNLQLLVSLFAFFKFYPVVSRQCKIHYSAGSVFFFFFFFCGLSLGLTEIGYIRLYLIIRLYYYYYSLEFFTPA